MRTRLKCAVSSNVDVFQFECTLRRRANVKSSARFREIFWRLRAQLKLSRDENGLSLAEPSAAGGTSVLRTIPRVAPGRVTTYIPSPSPRRNLHLRLLRAGANRLLFPIIARPAGRLYCVHRTIRRVAPGRVTTCTFTLSTPHAATLIFVYCAPAPTDFRFPPL